MNSVVEELLHALIKAKDVENLNAFKQILPFQSSQADRAFKLDFENRLKQNHKTWDKDNSSLQQVEIVLNLYQELLEESFHLSEDMLDSLLGTARNYSRFYMEDSLTNKKEGDLLAIVKEKGLKIMNNHKHFEVIILFWEALLFSPKFQVKLNHFQKLQ